MMSARGAVEGTRGVRTALVVLRGGEVTWIATVKVVEEGVEERVEEVEKEVEEEAEVMGVAGSASRSALAALAACGGDEGGGGGEMRTLHLPSLLPSHLLTPPLREVFKKQTNYILSTFGG